MNDAASALVPDSRPVFRRDGELLVPTPLATGPWYAGSQHGSAMLGLLARAVDRRAAESMTAFESTPPRNRAEIRRLGRRWGQVIRDGLEAMIDDGLKYSE